MTPGRYHGRSTNAQWRRERQARFVNDVLFLACVAAVLLVVYWSLPA